MELLSPRIQEELRDEGLAFTSPLGHREVALMVSDLENSRVSSSGRACFRSLSLVPGVRQTELQSRAL